MPIRSITIHLDGATGLDRVVLNPNVFLTFKDLIHNYRHGHMNSLDYVTQMRILKEGFPSDVIEFLYELNT